MFTNIYIYMYELFVYELMKPETYVNGTAGICKYLNIYKIYFSYICNSCYYGIFPNLYILYVFSLNECGAHI